MEPLQTEIKSVIMGNDVTSATGILELIHLRETAKPDMFTSESEYVTESMSLFASTVACHDGFDDALAKELIDRTATTVDIFSFIESFIIAAKIENTNLDAIPEKICTALRPYNYSKKLHEPLWGSRRDFQSSVCFSDGQ